MRYNKVECSTSARPYSTSHNVKVPFCMPEFSVKNMILHRFYVDNNEGELGIGYDTIIVRDLMVQIGLMADYKCQVLEWDVSAVPMKDTRGMIGQKYLKNREMSKVSIQTT